MSNTFGNDKPQSKELYFRIRRVSEKMKKETENIADHLGISTNDFLKVKLLDIINSYPEDYKKPFQK